MKKAFKLLSAALIALAALTMVSCGNKPVDLKTITAEELQGKYKLELKLVTKTDALSDNLTANGKITIEGDKVTYNFGMSEFVNGESVVEPGTRVEQEVKFEDFKKNFLDKIAAEVCTSDADVKEAEKAGATIEGKPFVYKTSDGLESDFVITLKKDKTELRFKMTKEN